MRALVLGGTGMLGKAVTAHWRHRQQAVLALSRQQADITDRRALDAACQSFRPETVINCAAFTQVDRCETERDQAMAVNGAAVGNVAAAARKVGARLIHISSDYVFAGDADAPYTEDATTGPRSVYGESKLRGEEEALQHPDALVVRASWLFGPGGPNFVVTIRNLLAERSELKVVDDQIGCPTYTPFLARALWDLGEAETSGIVHYCNRDAVSWHGFATEIARAVAPAARVLPVPTSEFPRPAPRPAFSVLATQRFEEAVGRQVEPWISGLAAFLQ
ncbi:MAG: dTDP-4-dehydrorhamnose reductase [Acidobacteriota bacterium]